MKYRVLTLYLMFVAAFILLTEKAPENFSLTDPKGRVRATLGQKGTLLISDTSRNQQRFVLDHSEPVSCFAFTDDGKLLASGGSRGLIKVWDVATGAVIATYRISSPSYFTPQVSSLRFSEDGDTLWVGVRRFSMDHPLKGYVLVIKARSGEVQGQSDSSLESP